MSGETPRGKIAIRQWLTTNQGVGAFIAVLCVAYLIIMALSPWAQRELRDGFTLGFFPRTATVLILLFAVLLMLDGRRRARIEALEGMSARIFLFCLAVVVGCAIYFYLTVEVGYLVVSPFFLFAFIYAMGLRPWRSAVLGGLAMTVIVYAVFRLLGIELPPGILPM